ncbi:MAG: hypothetical protein WEC00_01605 [Dongiaceae bacterium]
MPRGGAIDYFLHAIAVFIPVTRFMFDIWRDGVLQGEDEAYALDFVIRQIYRIRIAIEVLESVGEFTGPGRVVFDEIRRASEELDRDIVQAGLPQCGRALQLDKPTSRFVPAPSERHGRPLNSIEALLEHLALHDKAGQATRWRPVLEDVLARNCPTGG